METEDKKVEQAQIEQTAKEEEKEPTFITCPCCGKPTLIRPVKIKPQLLDQYMSCIISGVPFSHVYPVYEGRMKVTVSQLEQTMIGHLRNANKILAAWEPKLQDKIDTAQELNSLLRLYCSIPTIEVTSGTITKEFHPADVVTDVCSELYNVFQKDAESEQKLGYRELVDVVQAQLALLRSPKTAAGIPTALLMGVVEAHSQIYNILLGAGFDVNFWEGIELA